MVETEIGERASKVAVRWRTSMNGSGAPQSQADLRVSNAWRVLTAVREDGPTSRGRVAAETGLTQTTVHRIIGDLARRHLLEEDGAPERNGVGRPTTLFRFNKRAGYVIGIDVGNETTRAALADLDGSHLAEIQRPTSTMESDLLAGLERLIGELDEAAQIRPDAVVAIGVGIAGVTEASGTIVRPSLHRLWQGLQLGIQLRRYQSCEVVVAQDDHLAALAELHRGECVGARNAVVLEVGKGLGVGLIVDGAVQYGSRGAAGRIAWIPYPDGASEKPLGELATADGIIADYRALGGRVEAQGALQVFDADAQGEAAARGAIERFARRLGWVIAGAIALVDPQTVVVGGGVSGSFGRFGPLVRDRVAQIVPDPPPIVASKLGTQAVVTGAIDAALNAADAWLLARLTS